MISRRRACLAAAASCMSPLGALAQAAPPGPDFELQGHRGARGLLPENTLAGFSHALGIGVSALELDIAITADRELVISHDPLLNPDITRDATGRFLAQPGPPIVTLTYAQLAQYDVGRIRPGTTYARQYPGQQPVDGARIPRLKEVFELVRAARNEDVRFAIETKVRPHLPHETVEPVEFARLLLQAVRDAGMERRTSILSFDWRTLQVVQKEAPGMETVYLTMQRPGTIDNIGAGQAQGSAWTAGFQYQAHGSVPRMIVAAGGRTWSCFWRDLDADKVREAQALGLKVLAWTVNDVPTASQLMDAGVNGLVTDRPDLLRAEMQRRGLPLPRPTPVVQS